MSAETRARSLILPQEQHGPRPSGPLNKSIPSSVFSIARVCRPWLLAPAHGALQEGVFFPPAPGRKPASYLTPGDIGTPGSSPRHW